MQQLCAQPQTRMRDICISIAESTLLSFPNQTDVFKDYKNVNKIELVALLVPISTHLVVSCISPMHLHIGIVSRRSDTTLLSLLQTSQVNFNAH